MSRLRGLFALLVLVPAMALADVPNKTPVGDRAVLVTWHGEAEEVSRIESRGARCHSVSETGSAFLCIGVIAAPATPLLAVPGVGQVVVAGLVVTGLAAAGVTVYTKRQEIARFASNAWQEYLPGFVTGFVASLPPEISSRLQGSTVLPCASAWRGNRGVALTFPGPAIRVNPVTTMNLDGAVDGIGGEEGIWEPGDDIAGRDVDGIDADGIDEGADGFPVGDLDDMRPADIEAVLQGLRGRRVITAEEAEELGRILADAKEGGSLLDTVGEVIADRTDLPVEVVDTIEEALAAMHEGALAQRAAEVEALQTAAAALAGALIVTDLDEGASEDLVTRVENGELGPEQLFDELAKRGVEQKDIVIIVELMRRFTGN